MSRSNLFPQRAGAAPSRLYSLILRGVAIGAPLSRWAGAARSFLRVPDRNHPPFDL